MSATINLHGNFVDDPAQITKVLSALINMSRQAKKDHSAGMKEVLRVKSTDFKKLAGSDSTLPLSFLCVSGTPLLFSSDAMKEGIRRFGAQMLYADSDIPAHEQPRTLPQWMRWGLPVCVSAPETNDDRRCYDALACTPLPWIFRTRIPPRGLVSVGEYYVPEAFANAANFLWQHRTQFALTDATTAKQAMQNIYAARGYACSFVLHGPAQWMTIEDMAAHVEADATNSAEVVFWGDTCCDIPKAGDYPFQTMVLRQFAEIFPPRHPEHMQGEVDAVVFEEISAEVYDCSAESLQTLTKDGCKPIVFTNHPGRQYACIKFFGRCALSPGLRSFCLTSPRRIDNNDEIDEHHPLAAQYMVCDGQKKRVPGLSHYSVPYHTRTLTDGWYQSTPDTVAIVSDTQPDPRQLRAFALMSLDRTVYYRGFAVPETHPGAPIETDNSFIHAFLAATGAVSG